MCEWKEKKNQLFLYNKNNKIVYLSGFGMESISEEWQVENYYNIYVSFNYYGLWGVIS